MKRILICLILSLMGLGLQAQDRGLYWKYKDYDGSISVTLPRWVIHVGSWFADEKEDRKLIRKVRKVRALVFEDQDNPVTARDLQKFNRKAQRRGLEYMLSVREKQTRVEVWAKERRNALRKIVVIVHEPETFAMVSLRGKLKIEDISRLLDEIPKDEKNGADQEPLLHNVRSVIKI